MSKSMNTDKIQCLDYSSLITCLPSMWEAISSILSTKKVKDTVSSYSFIPTNVSWHTQPDTKTPLDITR